MILERGKTKSDKRTVVKVEELGAQSLEEMTIKQEGKACQ